MSENTYLVNGAKSTYCNVCPAKRKKKEGKRPWFALKKPPYVTVAEICFVSVSCESIEASNVCSAAVAFSSSTLLGP